MVRLGIGLHGVAATLNEQRQMQMVATLKTTISQIKQIHAGETVGYSRRGVAQKEMTIATVGIGYADGLSRRLGNGVGKMMVMGHLAPIVGSVCMDMTMIDITGIPAREGTEVMVFRTECMIITLAQQTGTIPYEVLTSIFRTGKTRVFPRVTGSVWFTSITLNPIPVNSRNYIGGDQVRLVHGGEEYFDTLLDLIDHASTISICRYTSLIVMIQEWSYLMR